MKKIQPNIDLQNSIECHRILDSNDFYKGKSFNFAGSWTPGLYYHNDEYCVDFVSYDGVMLACKKSHQSHSQTEPKIEWIDSKPVITSNHWNVVMWGTVGPAGETKIPQFKTEVVEGIVKIKYSYDNETWKDAGDIPSGSIRYENVLPESGEPGYLYIIHKKLDNVAQDQHDEYIWVTVGDEGGHWEKIGGSSSVTKEDITKIHDDIENIQITISNNTNVISTLQNVVDNLKLIDHDAYIAADTALETSLKDYVDGKDSEMDKRVEVLEGNDVYVKSDVDSAISTAKGEAISDANDYADGLASNYDAVGSAAAALTDAKSYVDGIVGDVTGEDGTITKGLNSRIADLEAIDHDKLAADVVATVLDGAPEKFDTLKEIAQWISDSETADSAADLVTRVSALESIDHGAYKGYVDTEIDKLSNTYMTEDQVTELIKETVTDTGNIDGGQDSWD